MPPLVVSQTAGPLHRPAGARLPGIPPRFPRKWEVCVWRSNLLASARRLAIGCMQPPRSSASDKGRSGVPLHERTTSSLKTYRVVVDVPDPIADCRRSLRASPRNLPSSYMEVKLAMFCHAPERENRSQFTECLVKPPVWVIPQKFVVRKGVAKFMGKLIGKLRPAPIACRQLNRDGVLPGDAVVDHWCEMVAWRRHNSDGACEGFPHQPVELRRDIE